MVGTSWKCPRVERLVTLTGLAASARHAWQPRPPRAWPSPHWFAELAPVTDPTEVPYAVLDGLGLRERSIAPARRGNGRRPSWPLDLRPRPAGSGPHSGQLRARHRHRRQPGGLGLLNDCPRVKILSPPAASHSRSPAKPSTLSPRWPPRANPMFGNPPPTRRAALRGPCRRRPPRPARCEQRGSRSQHLPKTWTACRWPSSWPPPGCARCPRRSWPRASNDRFAHAHSRQPSALPQAPDPARRRRLELGPLSERSGSLPDGLAIFPGEIASTAAERVCSRPARTGS